MKEKVNVKICKSPTATQRLPVATSVTANSNSNSNSGGNNINADCNMQPFLFFSA